MTSLLCSIARSAEIQSNVGVRFRGTTNDGNETSRELNLTGAYREIGVLRPDGVVGVVALVRVPVHGGLFGVGERDGRVAKVVVGRMVERVRGGDGRRRD